MSKQKTFEQTTRVFSDLVRRQGGSFYLGRNNAYTITFGDYVSALRENVDKKPFVISIYNQDLNRDLLSLTFLVNPSDINLGNVFVVNQAYTRKGWVVTLWGNDLGTIVANGTTPGFYLFDNGLVNLSRTNSISFINLLSIIGIFRNNGSYHLSSKMDQTLFRDGFSRVINVIDSISISYDGTEYLGYFNTFTSDEDADHPYSMKYNIEFVVSGLKGDLIEGHLRKGNNYKDTAPVIGNQGANIKFETTVQMDVDQLNKFYRETERAPTGTLDQSFSYTDEELENEYAFYDANKDENLYKVPPDTVRITRGANDKEGHNGKIDYRTDSGQALSFTDGVVHFVRRGGNVKGASNYIVIRSSVGEGADRKEVFIRYFHIDHDTMANLKVGQQIAAGDFLGNEGTDGDEFVAHIDFEVREIAPGTSGAPLTQYKNSKRIDASSVFYDGVDRLKRLGKTDYKNIQYKHGSKR